MSKQPRKIKVKENEHIEIHGSNGFVLSVICREEKYQIFANDRDSQCFVYNRMVTVPVDPWNVFEYGEQGENGHIKYTRHPSGERGRVVVETTDASWKAFMEDWNKKRAEESATAGETP